MSIDEQSRTADIARQLREAHGVWPAAYDADVVDAEILADYLELLSHPRRNGPLDETTEELVCLAVAAATTHLYPPAIRYHTEQAVAEGVSHREILMVLFVTAQLGNHSVTHGATILAEEADLDNDTSTDERRRELHEAFDRERDYWGPLAEPMTNLVDLDPDFFDAMTGLTHHIYRGADLDRKLLELVSIAIDASTTHLYEPGTRTHVRNALDAGATPAEIMEVFELAAVLGGHTFHAAVPIVTEVFTEHNG